MFIDYAEISLRAGNGGYGAIAFRREKYVPKGGPSGGNGGNGGSVFVEGNENLNTLLDFRYKSKYEASNGVNGGVSLMDGKKGEDVIIYLPVGTIIKNAETGQIIFDITAHGQKFCIAKGGRGGKGNSNFATPTKQAPRWAEDGGKGEELSISLELKLIADVGLVGFPNAGKSTLISKISSARPKIADYPFTTLEPNLGIVRYKNYQSFTVADIPGIIEGASDGKGLGLQFLRHIERTRILCFLIDCTSEDVKKQFKILKAELASYSDLMLEKEIIITLSKVDLLDDDTKKELSKIKINKSKIFAFSSATGEGLETLMNEMWRKIEISKTK